MYFSWSTARSHTASNASEHSLTTAGSSLNSLGGSAQSPSPVIERLVAASGLPPIRLHDLRHGAATLMLAAGIDVKIVSDTLGHSDTHITRDIYQSVLPQVGKNAAEATAKLVPLQRKTEAEEARKAAKKAKDKAKAEARAKRKGKGKKPKK